MKSNTRRMAGFTLVELLVVITIIGMLMALLLPAVNAATEQARQAKCKNRMRNLAIAAVSFESTHGRYPGYREYIGQNQGNANGSTGQNGFSWIAACLPQLDHHDWYDEFLDGANNARYWDLVLCPSNPPTATNKGFNAFCINAGHHTGSGDGKTSGGEWPADGVAHDYAGDGTSTSAGFVTDADGTTNTVLVTENVQAGEWHLGGKVGATVVWHLNDSDQVRRINNRGTQPSLLSLNLNMNTCRPSSFHRGVNMVFCGTNVKFVPESIDYKVYQNLLTVNNTESHAPDKTHVLSDDQYH